MKECKIVPSVIAKDDKELYLLLSKARSFSDRVHLDLMDGRFVPNRSLDFDISINKEGLFVELHMMVKKPLRRIKDNINNADLFIVHLSAIDKEEWIEIVDYLKFMNKKAGIALDPEIDAEKVLPFVEDLDHILIMTVHPGKYGASFLPETLEKVRQLRKTAPDIDIGVDGGMDPKNIKLAKEAGANIFISGSYIMKASSPKTAYDKLIRSLKQS